jgi:hypothetical protein
MMLISSISDVNCCYCKWIEIAVDLEVSNGPELALGPQKSYLMNQTLGEGFRRRGGVVLRAASFF